MMKAIALTSLFGFVLPVFIGVQFLKISVVTAWLWVVLFIVLLCCTSGWRYRSGIWKEMLVIENEEAG